MVTCTKTHFWIFKLNWYLVKKIRNHCPINKICVFTSLLRQIYWPVLCNQIYWAVNAGCHSCCHHHKFTFRVHLHSNVAIVDSWWRTSHTLSNDAIWDLYHDLYHDLSSDLTESLGFSFVNTTWVKTYDSLKWDSVHVQVKSQVKSEWIRPQVLTHICICKHSKLSFSHIVGISVNTFYFKTHHWSNSICHSQAIMNTTINSKHFTVLRVWEIKFLTAMLNTEHNIQYMAKLGSYTWLDKNIFGWHMIPKVIGYLLWFFS